MLLSFLIYLLESSLCLLLFACFYKLVLQKLTFFYWIRYYLIASLIFAVIIPTVDIPILLNSKPVYLNIYPSQILRLNELQMPYSSSGSSFSEQGILNFQNVILYVALFAYSLVALFKLVLFIKKLANIQHLISANKKTKEPHYWIVTIQDALPAFSFFRYIFINKDLEKLDKYKFDIIREHESVHANQLHSLDIILSEILLIIFWFNPIVYFYKKYIHETHEFIVDEQLTHTPGNKKAYSNLLLNLAVHNVNISPFLGFSSIQINKRINMLNKQKSNAMKKISFILILPVISILLLSFSVYEKPAETSHSKKQATNIEKLKIGEIEWEGNMAFKSKQLDKLLGYKKGDDYNHDIYNKLMNDGSIQSLYLNNGFVFYKGEYEESIENGFVNLKIKIYEGIKGEIGIISIVGNSKNSVKQIKSRLSIKSGDLFSKSKIGESVSAIEKLENLANREIEIRVIPEQNKLTEKGYAVIDLEFVIHSKKIR